MGRGRSEASTTRSGSHRGADAEVPDFRQKSATSAPARRDAPDWDYPASLELLVMASLSLSSADP